VLKLELQKILTTSPDVIQFAKDRKYEAAWIISACDDRPTQLDIKNYLAKEKFELLIVEYIWNSTDDDKRFVLTLFQDQNCQLQDKQKFIEVCLKLFYTSLKFGDFIDEIDKKIIGRPYLLQHPFDEVNIGVFNHWLSIGPINLWRIGDDYNFEKTMKKIQSKSEVYRSNLNYQGLLFRFNIKNEQTGPSFGIKTPCCIKKNDYWEVDKKKINYWMKLFLGLNCHARTPRG